LAKVKSYNRRKAYASNKIDKLFVFELSDWICVLCHTKIDNSLRIPNPDAVTLEHLIPLSRGGKHIDTNVGPAHAHCNFEKSNLLMEEYGIRKGLDQMVESR
jgi:5-methylcytosine-specific restriction endonuclease McrA